MKTLLMLNAGLLAAGAASAATITYTFETPGNITGTGATTAYSAPDSNAFGAGISVSSFTMSDLDGYNGTFSAFGDVLNSNGGARESTEAVVADRGVASTVEFTLTIEDGYTADFTNITFDTSYFTDLNAGGGTNVDWQFETIVGAAPSTNITTSGSYNHDNAPDYQRTDLGALSSGDISLTGLTGLTNTTVTFLFTLNADRNHAIDRRNIGIDDIILTGTIPEPSSYALLAGCLGFVAVMLRRRR